jgi:hypothetical protein
MITEEDLAGSNVSEMTIAANRLATERNGDDWLYDDYDYMSSVLEAARSCNISPLADWDMPEHTKNWEATCRNFRAEANRVSQRILFEQFSQATVDPNTVALDAKAKEIIRFHLGQVRAIIDKGPIPDWKKQDIIDAIAALEREIDKARTRRAAVLEVIGKTVGDLAGKPLGSVVSEILAPVLKIVSIVEDANATEKEKAKLIAATKPRADRVS